MSIEHRCYATFDGLDASGKSTIIKELSSKGDDFISFRCPPDWMRPLRKVFDKTRVETRFIYYAIGNLWMDKFILSPILKNIDLKKKVLLDRHWLSTLSAHEVRGIGQSWLENGKKIARACRRPDISLIIHCDIEERYRRLTNRGLITDTDIQNLQFGATMENGYYKWAEQLSWTTKEIDTTNKSSTESCNLILKLLRNN